MIYTIQEGQSFDAEILRQELVAAIGADGWYITTGGDQVQFVQTESNFDPEAIILTHFANGEKRANNSLVLEQIRKLEATQTPRRVREGGPWLSNLDGQIATLRKQLQ